MIKANTKTILEVLDQAEEYIVPDYQRNFDWRKTNAADFWYDILNGGTFLGTFVFLKKENRQYTIVDGQQRLTTIFILLAACRTRAQELKDSELVNVIQARLSALDVYTGKSTKPRLKTSNSIRDVFNSTIANPKWTSDNFHFKGKRRQVSRISPLYKFFKEKISQYNKTQIADVLKKVYESTVVSIEISDVQEAFDIFERTNARGMELNAADLLKNYLFSRRASDSIKEDWSNIVDNAGGTIVRMLKYFYVSRKGGLIRKRELFGSLKIYGEKITAKKLLGELKEFSYLFSIISDSSYEDIKTYISDSKLKELSKEYNAKTLYRSFDALRLFKITQGYPLIIKIMEVLPSVSDKNMARRIEKKFLELINAMEKYHFINNAVSQRPGNEVEKYYANKCKTNITGKNILHFMNVIIKDLQEKLVSENEFIERFKELSYDNDFQLIYYISDRLNNYGRKGGQYVEIYNPDRRILKKNYNLDHLVAQDLKEYKFNKEEIGDYINNIGNLLLISLHTNSELQDKHITKKFEILQEKDSINLPEVRQFIKNWRERDWSNINAIKDNIDRRAENIGRRSYQEVWKF